MKAFSDDDGNVLIMSDEAATVVDKHPRILALRELEKLGGCPFDEKKDIVCTFPECGCHEEEEGE